MTAGEAVPNLHSRASPSALMKHCNQSLAQSKEKLLLSRLAARLWRLDIPLLRELDDLASAFMVPTLNGMGLCQDGHLAIRANRWQNHVGGGYAFLAVSI
jgi:hypothetical protein